MKENLMDGYHAFINFLRQIADLTCQARYIRSI